MQEAVCPECQAHNPADSDFCGKCGTALKEAKVVESRPPQSPARQTPPARRKVPWWVIAGAVEVLGACLLCGIVWVIGSPRGERGTATPIVAVSSTAPVSTPIPDQGPDPTETETPTPAPSATPSPTTSPSPSLTPSTTPTPSITPMRTPVPTYTPSRTSALTPMPTETPTPTDTPEPTDTPTPTRTPRPTNTPWPTDTPIPPTNTPPPPTDTATSTPTSALPPAYTIVVNEVAFEPWGRPQNSDGCHGPYNDQDPIKRFTIKIVLTNNSNRSIPDDWQPIFYTAKGRVPLTCIWRYNNTAVKPGETIYVTFATHVELDDWVSAMALSELDYEVKICFNAKGQVVSCQ